MELILVESYFHTKIPMKLKYLFKLMTVQSNTMMDSGV